jgi:20S proteasome alpha/beta subunit
MSAICCEAADGGNLLDAIRSRDRWYHDDQQISVASLSKTLREIIRGMVKLMLFIHSVF